MPIFAVVLVNVVSLAVVTVGIVRSGERSQVLLYAFIFDCILSLLTIHAITRLLREKPVGRLARLLPLASSRPAPGQSSYAMTAQDSGRPVGTGGYLFVMAFLAFLAFVLGNVNADHELDLDLPTFLHDVRWSVALALTQGDWASRKLRCAGSSRNALMRSRKSRRWARRDCLPGATGTLFHPPPPYKSTRIKKPRNR